MTKCKYHFLQWIKLWLWQTFSWRKPGTYDGRLTRKWNVNVYTKWTFAITDAGQFSVAIPLAISNIATKIANQLIQQSAQMKYRPETLLNSDISLRVKQLFFADVVQSAQFTLPRSLEGSMYRAGIREYVAGGHKGDGSGMKR